VLLASLFGRDVERNKGAPLKSPAGGKIHPKNYFQAVFNTLVGPMKQALHARSVRRSMEPAVLPDVNAGTV